MIAYDYPILGLFWSMLLFFLFFAWIILLFRVFADIFRSDDMGGVAKAIWSIFVIIVPFLGVFVYVLARGDGMTKRNIEDAQQSQQAFQDYVRQTAGTGGVASELSQLNDLKSQGAITEAEFEAQKAKLLAN
jgi:hypothetical protein